MAVPVVEVRIMRMAMHQRSVFVPVDVRLPARIAALRHEGPLVRVTLDAGFPLVALVTRPAREELGLSEGVAVTAYVKAPAVHLIRR